MRAVFCFTLCLLAKTAVTTMPDPNLTKFRISFRQESSFNKLSRRTSNQDSVKAESETRVGQNGGNKLQRTASPKVNSAPARIARTDIVTPAGQRSRKRQRPNSSRPSDRSPSPRRPSPSAVGSLPPRISGRRSGTHQSQSGMAPSADDFSSSSDSLSQSPSVGLLSLSSEHGSRQMSPSDAPRHTRAGVRLYGPGVTVVGSSQLHPQYSNIRTGETTSHRIEDFHRAKAAGTSYEHTGAAVASARGRTVKAKVDARRSIEGGSLTTSWHGQEPWNVAVAPGTLAFVRYDDSHTNGQAITMKAAILGKGSVQASATEDAPSPPALWPPEPAPAPDSAPAQST